MTPVRLLLLVCATSLVACGSSGVGTGPDAAGGDIDAGITEDAYGADAANACAATETCDGVVDDDCDGQVDEGCGRCPLLAVSCPTGCCPVETWEIDTADSLGADLAVAADGTIFFAYSKPSGNIWSATLAIYEPSPGTWRKISLGAGSYRNRVRIDAMGRVHVASAARSGDIKYRRSVDHGQTFSEPVTVGTLGATLSTFDMEVDSTGTPHVAWSADKPSSYQSTLRYARLDGTTWVGGIVDNDSGASEDPDLAIGFADRPHIVYQAHNAPGVPGGSKRYTFYNGNRWLTETVDHRAVGQTYSAEHYFAAHSLRIWPDDSRELLFERTENNVATLLLARRGPSDTDPWVVSPLTGATGFTTTIMFIDAHGARAAVSDGLRLHREQGTTAWVSTPIGLLGRGAAIARRGRYLYVGYRAGTGSSGRPMITVVDLGP